MKSILVPTGGSDTDNSVFQTARAAARLFSAHLQFVHIRVSPAQAAAYTPGVNFAMGTAALRDELNRLRTEADDRSNAASRHVHEFCSREMIDFVDAPSFSRAVTASWREEECEPCERLMFYSRHSDLVVMGRAKRPNGLPLDLIDILLLGCGRPMLLAAATAPSRLAGTIIVGWRETPEAARAVAAAMPLLTKAERVVFVAVDEGAEGTADAVDDVARQFRWNGISADAELVAPGGRSVSEVLFAVAQTRGANLMVMGAYGHSPTRERIFGGCTQAAIRHADIPVLLLH